MFNFNQILSLTFDRKTGKTIATYHDIVAAKLCDDYDRASGGANTYEVHLSSVDAELDEPILGLTITVGNSGDWVQVQKGLNPKAGQEIEQRIFQLEMVDAIIENKLLIVTSAEGEGV